MNSNARVVSFLSAPGGVGKTTFAMCLAWLFRLEGKRVLLIDLDPSYGLSLRLIEFKRYLERVRRKRTIADLLAKLKEGDDVDYHEFITEVKFKEIYFDVIVSSEDLSEVIDTTWYGSEAGREYTLQELIDTLGMRKDYDLIIIDTIPFYEPKYSIITLFASDISIIPLRPTFIDALRTINMIKTLRSKTRKIFQDEIIFFNKFIGVFNMVETGTKAEKNIKNYKTFMNDALPRLRFLTNYVTKRIAFQRIGTKEEQSDDEKNVKTAFGEVFKEIKSTLFS